MLPHTDMRFALIAWLPAWLRPYALLSRWDRPVGVWLLLLPCWWGLALAPLPLSPSLLALFAVGAVVMRGAGCTLNDVLDHRLDAQVARTRGRPLPSGAVTRWQAMLWLGLQLLAGAFILFSLSPLAIRLGIGALLLVGLYPLLKRVTWWPQLWLGLTFNWGILLATAAVAPQIAHNVLLHCCTSCSCLVPPPIPLAVWLLYGAAICWTLVYDTIYAHQDCADDALVGIKSTARLFGRHSKKIVCGIAGLMVALFAAVGWVGHEGLGHLSLGYWAGLSLAALHTGWQLAVWQPDNPASCLSVFRAHRDFGLLIFLALLLGR
jgi:4-hydroxybenzoate polyprenyltransferase